MNSTALALYEARDRDTPRDVSSYDPIRESARCDLCPLQGNVVVPYEAPSKKIHLAIVGEGPGRKEELIKVPFVGATGQRLDEELEDAQLDRATAHVSNATCCAGDSDEDNKRAAECCAPRLLRELARLPSDVPLVLLGKAAARSVLGVNSILLARGFVWTARSWEEPIAAAETALRKAKKGDDATKVQNAELRLATLKGRHALVGRTVLPSLHPTFAFIHNETWAPIFTVDLDRVSRWVRKELRAEDLADRITRVHSLQELRASERVFVTTDNVKEIDAASRILGHEIACDIETERIKPLTPLKARILTVQLSDGVRSVVIAPWDKERHTAALSRFFRGRTVVAHNGFCFDWLALKRDGVVIGDDVQLEDTLTAHHAFAGHLPQKLDHVVATFCDSGPWKIRHGVRGAEEKGLAPQRVEEGDLELYGASDAALTILAWRAMQADLAPERKVYEHDKRRSLLYAEMQVNGYAVDRKRRRLLIKLLRKRSAALKGLMRRIAHRPNFQPSKLSDVRRVLFGTLKAPFLNPTPTGLAGTSNATLEALRTGDTGSDETRETRVARFSEALLNWRVCEKVRNTYLEPVQIHEDSRAHYNIKPFGVLTGRPASRILSAPRWSRQVVERVREIYVAGAGCDLVYFDLAQAEARFAANLSGDQAFIEACLKDVHTRNALILFPDAREALERDPKGKHCPRHGERGDDRAKCNCGKSFRDVTKNAFFAIIYRAGYKKVLAYLRSQGFAVDLGQVEDMFAAVRDAYRTYDGYVESNIDFVRKNGFLRTAIMNRIMWIGFHPELAVCANLPIQSGIADVMDMRLLDIIIPRLRGTGAKMVLHHYDSATFDTPKRAVDKVRGVIEDTWKEPVRLNKSIVCRGDVEFMLPAETKVGRRWSEL